MRHTARWAQNGNDAENYANGSMAGGPVGQLYNSDPLCPGGVLPMDDPHHPLTLDPVGQPPITGPSDKHVSEPGCGRINRIQDDPGGSTGILDTASQTSSNVSADRLNIGTFGRLANSVDATQVIREYIVGKNSGKT